MMLYQTAGVNARKKSNGSFRRSLFGEPVMSRSETVRFVCGTFRRFR
ncbi:MAG: hypothetical protein LBK83_08305 [Treponema sp.]|nr:hypothetical protein [Treponema sp.]